MKYLQYHFTFTPSAEAYCDLLSAMLCDIGFDSFVTEDDLSLTAYVQPQACDDEHVNGVVEAFPIPDVAIAYTQTEAPDENWNAVWESEGFRPIILGQELAVHDPAHTDIPPVQRHILIRPRQAFGTGSHQTTRLILSTLMQMDLRGRHVVDAGTGTGILAIMACMQGAQAVTAYDIDEWSVDNTRENLEFNHIDTPVQVLHGDASVLSQVRGVDLLIANINRNILLADMPAFVRTLNADGELILSGFYASDVEILTQKAAQLGLHVIDRKEEEEWTMLRLRGNSYPN